MNLQNFTRLTLSYGLASLLLACGSQQTSSSDGTSNTPQRAAATREQREEAERTTIWDLFRNSANPNTTVAVNRYLWQASLDVLNFMPIESVDPFTGVIVMGYGAPPGGGRAYRATVYISDPALDARSLKVSLQGRGGGAVSAETQRAIEDAILTRARAIRVRDSKM